MKNTNGNLPAMPNVTDAQTLNCMGMMNTVADFYRHGAGLTKREMFAIEFAAAMVSNPQLDATIPALGVAKMAIEHTDALLAELERTA